MPKRKVKEEKPRKRLGKKELLIPPAAMGVSLVTTLVIIPQVAPPPLPLDVCLKGHNVDTFSIHPTVEVLVDGKMKQLPSGIGNETIDGKECLGPIHTDVKGNNKLPPASLGNRQLSLFTKINPPLITPETVNQIKYLQLELSDADSSLTDSYVTKSGDLYLELTLPDISFRIL